jgi:N-acyl-D-aspartate/D-glutamate deacylase
MTAPSHDLVVRGAVVVDGSGAPGVEADVAIDGDRIAHVGAVRGVGREELDGRGRVLAPGFIDPHTHLDANLFWDPDVTPCSSYGVTTVVTGNCGYTLAPVADAAARDYVVDALCTVEQIPRAAVDESVSFRFGSQRDYFEVLERLPVLCNFATLVGHVPIRTAVLGPDAARERVATLDEIAAIAGLVVEGARLGALGFSTDQVVGNYGPEGTALPGQVCDDDELLAVARALGGARGPGLFTMAPRALLQGRVEREADLEWHARLAAASGKPVVVGPVFDRWSEPDVGYDLVDRTAARSSVDAPVVPQISTRVFELWTRLDMPGLLVRALPTLRAAVDRGGADGVRALASDADARARLRDEADRVEPTLVWSGRWEHVAIRWTPSRPDLYGRSVHDVAMERGVRVADLLLDLAVADDCETQFAPSMANDDDDRLARMVAHPAAMIGASDAGAHVLSNTDSCYAVWTLQHWVRERAVLTLEHAVRKLTADQADLLGLADRGRVRAGLAADLVLFDPDTVGTTGVRFVSDQPAGGRRLVTDATGVAASVVNGVVVTRDGRPTGARPGRFLRATEGRPHD